MRRVERVKARVSFADLQRMPDDGNRYELYDGELRVVPSPVLKHQIVSGRLYEALVEYRSRHGGRVFYAPLDIVLSDYDVLQPDLTYFGAERASRLHPDRHVRVVPDLAIEVLSPSTERIDRGRKRDVLARYGLPEFWIVDPRAKCVEVSVLCGDRFGDPVVTKSGTLESPTVRGLTIHVAALFEGL
jgi:Uma2 family endonuclease